MIDIVLEWDWDLIAKILAGLALFVFMVCPNEF